MQENKKKPIASYNDLEVYQETYSAAIRVNKEIITRLPEYEKFDLINQLRRSSKAVPRLIAEGYAKRHQKMGFQKYLDDAMSECNETSVGLKQCRDIYNIECGDLIEAYERAGRRIYRLAEVWTTFKRRVSQLPCLPARQANPTSSFKPASQP